MKKEEKYNIVGYINTFEIVPEYILPVFESNNKYFYEYSEEFISIDGFIQIHKMGILNNMILLNDSDKVDGNLENYSIGDESVVGFDFGDRLFFGTISDFSKYIDSNRTAHTEFSKIK